MKNLNAIIETPRDQLALDEAMLMSAEKRGSGEVLRVWEFAEPVVVAGRSTRLEYEVDLSFCRSTGVEVLRRCSGGASVVGGPGCLMYSVVLSMLEKPELRKIDFAHQYVMSKVLNAVRLQLPEVELRGICDLAWHEKKCSGNSLRIHRDYLLYHGTILYDFDLQFLDQCLKGAPRQPEYRLGRQHYEFVTNVPIDPKGFADTLCDHFAVTDAAELSTYEPIMNEVKENRYDTEAWHTRH